jgi:hypothetical protein
VGGRDESPFYGFERRDARVIQIGEHRPTRRHLDRVDDNAPPVQRSQSRDIVPVLYPALDQFRLERFRPGVTALGVCNLQGRLEDHGIGLVEHYEDGARLLGEIACGLDLVVEPEHCGSRATAQYAAARFEAVREVGEAPGATTFGGCHGVKAQPRVGHYPESSLRPDEQLVQVGSDRGARCGPAGG